MRTAAKLGSGAQTVQTVSTAASTATSGAATAGLISAGAATGIGLAVAGVTIAIMAIIGRKGPKQRIATTDIVNDLEPQLQANVDAYFSGPRTAESQAQALANFDAAWEWLKSSAACGNPDMGNPGKACIRDRDRGGRWDWFSYYRDPIANDRPRTDAAAVLFPSLGEETGSLLLPALLIAVGLML